MRRARSMRKRRRDRGFTLIELLITLGVTTIALIGLLSLHEGRAACSTVARRHLLPGTPTYLGDSLRYRRRLAAHWSQLAEAVRHGGSPRRLTS